MHVDPARHIVAELALDEVRDSRRELHDLEPTLQFTTRIGHDFAVLTTDEMRQLIGVGETQLAPPEQHARSIERRPGAPRRRRRRGIGDNGFDVDGISKRHVRRDGARGRIVDGSRARGVCVMASASDDMRNAWQSHA